MDKIGSVIVLSSYFLLIPISVFALFAVVLFIIGVIVSTYGLNQHADQKWVGVYAALSSGLLFCVFPILQNFGVWGFGFIYVVPIVSASSSLIIAHLTKDSPQSQKTS